MEIILILAIIVAVLLSALGIIGCIVPVLPGPVFSYLALIVYHFAEGGRVFSTTFLLIWLAITILAMMLDYFMPAYTTKKFGGSTKGVLGGVIGLFIGIFFFPPFGIILGPLIGAIVGDLVAGKQLQTAFKSGLGSLFGLLIATTIKLAISITMTVFLLFEIVKLIGKDLNFFG